MQCTCCSVICRPSLFAKRHKHYRKRRLPKSSQSAGKLGYVVIMTRFLISCFCDKTSESLQTVFPPPLTQPLFPLRVTGVNWDTETVISLGKGHVAGDYSTGLINKAAAGLFICKWSTVLALSCVVNVGKENLFLHENVSVVQVEGWTGSQHAVNLQLLRLTSAPVQQTTKETHESLMVINLQSVPSSMQMNTRLCHSLSWYERLKPLVEANVQHLAI